MPSHDSMSLTSARSTLAVAIGISFWLLVGCVPVVPPPPPRWPPPSYPHYSRLPPAPEPGFSVPSRPPTDLHPGVPRIEEPLPKAEEPPPPPKQPDQPLEWVNPPPMDENP